MGALEQFNSQGHISAEALIQSHPPIHLSLSTPVSRQIWAAWKASGDTWHTQRDSVRLIVFNAAVQLALDECMRSEPSKLPTSGPSFLVAMAEAVSLAPPAALAAVPGLTISLSPSAPRPACSSHQPSKLPASGPSFIVAMAEAMSLAPPAALAAALRGVASRVTAGLVACNVSALCCLFAAPL
ncbi:unnamed protein product [Closterium sp. Yama58-4]|nr:unnamed protein product [Closterium sp. Yama58-4]